MQHGIAPIWRRLIEGLQAEIGFDPTQTRFEGTAEHLHVHSSVKGVEIGCFLMDRALGRPEDAADDARKIAEHLLKVAWLREGDHVAPLETRLPRHRLMDEVMAHAGIDAQSLLDEMWSARLAARARGVTGSRYRWATHEHMPAMIANRDRRGGREVSAWQLRRVSDTYLAGDLVQVGWRIDTAVLDGRIAIHLENKGVVLTFKDMLPETVICSLQGRALSQIVSHPALDPLEIVVSTACRRGTVTALWLGGKFIREGGPSRHPDGPAPPGATPMVEELIRELAQNRSKKP